MSVTWTVATATLFRHRDDVAAMDLNEILVFARVVQVGSFTGAARELDMPKSTVSRKVSELEERLGARLLQRTTRKLSLTDVGQTYYQHAARVVAELEEAELAVTRMQDAPRGLLRVTTPLNFGFLGPTIATFLERNPEVQIELVCADRVVDLVQEGFDLAVRAGPLADSSLIARRLGTFESFVVASPDFVAEAAEPRTPRDLGRLDCLVFGAGPDRTQWKLHRGGKTVAVRVEPRLIVNDFDFLMAAAIGGLGVAMLPVFRCAELLRTGTLRRLLPEWCSLEIPIHAVYPSTRHLSPKVKAFLDHLREEMTPPPWERAPVLERKRRRSRR
jgi:DNA-binding transcriptional LysR family regulator